tara:strand:+ start:61 stop:1797 length:1737 start_codon:yes stop_codon:yes gene_type:complete
MVQNPEASNNRTGMDAQLNGEDINFNRVFQRLNRNKRLVAISALSGLILFGSYKAFLTDRIYEGEFQIVIDQKQGQRKMSGVTANMMNFLPDEAAKVPTKIKTQKEILRSPSVLLGVFEFVQKEKGQKLYYKSWVANNVKVSILKGTSILQFRYLDKDKDLVLEVLDRISSTYQEYSGKERKRNIELGIKYFNDQIAEASSKNNQSIRKVQEYAMLHDLAISKLAVSPKSLDRITLDPQMDNPITLSIESNRVAYSNRIRLINEQLRRIQNFPEDSEKIVYIAQSIDTSNMNIFPEITVFNQIDTKLANLRTTYQDADKNIQDLLQERVLLIKSLNRRVKLFLQAQRIDAEILLESTKRPDGILLKYRELLSNSQRDTATLNVLENQYRQLLLDKARTQDPWKLITKPSLILIDYGTKLINTAFLGLVLGLIGGAGIAIANEKYKGIVFSSEEMSELIDWPLLAELFINQKQSAEETFSLLYSGKFAEIEGSVAVVPIGEIAHGTISQFGQYLDKSPSGIQFKITNELAEVTKYSNIILLAAVGVTNKKEILDAKTKLLIQNTPILGLISINEIKPQQ